MHRRRAGYGFTLIELMIVVAIIGLLAAIAVPNFLRFQSRAKQSEAKSNLKALFTSQRAIFQEYDRYSTSLLEVGFLPERNNRYAYYASPEGPTNILARTSSLEEPCHDCEGVAVDTFKYADAASNPPAFEPEGVPLGISGDHCPFCEWAGEAVGNIDSDAVLDHWSIATVDRMIAAGNFSAGEPANELSDVTQ